MNKNINNFEMSRLRVAPQRPAPNDDLGKLTTKRQNLNRTRLPTRFTKRMSTAKKREKVAQSGKITPRTPMPRQSNLHTQVPDGSSTNDLNTWRSKMHPVDYTPS